MFSSPHTACPQARPLHRDRHKRRVFSLESGHILCGSNLFRQFSVSCPRYRFYTLPGKSIPVPLMRRTITHASRNSCAEIALQGASPQALASRIALSVWFLLCWRTRTTLSVLLGMLSSFQLTKPSSSASSSVRLRAACRLAGCCSYSSSRLSRASALGPPPQRAAYLQHPSHRSQPGLTATCLCPRTTRSPSRRACRSP